MLIFVNRDFAPVRNISAETGISGIESRLGRSRRSSRCDDDADVGGTDAEIWELWDCSLAALAWFLASSATWVVISIRQYVVIGPQSSYTSPQTMPCDSSSSCLRTSQNI